MSENTKPVEAPTADQNKPTEQPVTDDGARSKAAQSGDLPSEIDALLAQAEQISGNDNYLCPPAAPPPPLPVEPKPMSMLERVVARYSDAFCEQALQRIEENISKRLEAVVRDRDYNDIAEKAAAEKVDEIVAEIESGLDDKVNEAFCNNDSKWQRLVAHQVDSFQSDFLSDVASQMGGDISSSDVAEAAIDQGHVDEEDVKNELADRVLENISMSDIAEEAVENFDMDELAAKVADQLEGETLTGKVVEAICESRWFTGSIEGQVEKIVSEKVAVLLGVK